MICIELILLLGKLKSEKAFKNSQNSLSRDSEVGDEWKMVRSNESRAAAVEVKGEEVEH